MSHANVLRCSTDRETAFGVANGSPSWIDQQVITGTFKPNPKMGVLPNKTATTRLNRQYRHRRMSKFGAGFAAGFYLDGLAAPLATGSTYTAPQNNILEMMACMLGGVRGGAGSTAAGTPSTTAVDVQTGHGTRFAAGGAAIFTTANGLEMVEIDSVSTDTLNLRWALSAAPAADSAVYNTVTVYVDPSGAGGDGNSLAFRFLGEDAEDQWIFRGCCPSGFTLRSNLDDYLAIDTQFTAADWDIVSGETLGDPTFVGAGPLPYRTGSLIYGAYGVTTRAHLRAHNISFNPGIAFQPQRYAGGIETVDRCRMMPTNPRLEADVLFYQHEFDEFWTEYQDDTVEKFAFAQFGNTVAPSGTGMVGVSLPHAIFAAEPERNAGEEGFVEAKVAFDGMEDTGTGAASSALERSIERWHFG